VTQRQAGDTIEAVFRLGDDPFVVVPVTVVDDSPERIAHFIPYGTRYLSRTFPDGNPLPRVMTIEEYRRYEPVLTPRTWKRHALVTTAPGLAHAVRGWWTPAWEFGGWYVNLQAPLRRTLTGFTTEDHFLDILVAPDRTWTWKDDEELALAVERGRITPVLSDAIRAEGERVVKTIARAGFPFDGALAEWRPDPAWPVPTLGATWNASMEGK